MNQEDFEKAIEILDLKGSVSMNFLKKRYRKLIKQYHSDLIDNPDSNTEQKAREINWAYKILTDYCSQYEIPLDSKSFPSLNYKEWWNEQFGSSSFRKED